MIKEYYEQLYDHKFDNLGEIDQFLERHKLLKFIQGETYNLDRPISILKIKPIIDNLPKQAPMISLMNSTK